MNQLPPGFSPKRGLLAGIICGLLALGGIVVSGIALTKIIRYLAGATVLIVGLFAYLTIKLLCGTIDSNSRDYRHYDLKKTEINLKGKEMDNEKDVKIEKIRATTKIKVHEIDASRPVVVASQSSKAPVSSMTPEDAMARRYGIVRTQVNPVYYSQPEPRYDTSNPYGRIQNLINEARRIQGVNQELLWIAKRRNATRWECQKYETVIANCDRTIQQAELQRQKISDASREATLRQQGYR